MAMTIISMGMELKFNSQSFVRHDIKVNRSSWVWNRFYITIVYYMYNNSDSQ